MKKITQFIVALTLSTSAYAADLSESTLQGEWLVVEFMGSPDEDNTKWQFEGNQFYQKMGNSRMSPDQFEIKEGTIDLDYAQIEVTSFDGKNMEAIMADFKYRLIKQ
ncbi:MULTISPECIES: hypothetical protein [unclassified Agarivorans]|uniref:hypothetical protein n=1 Tax=unclassified Agarivorans TaxID=2636026 RepID=UPI0026E402CB|nr:MULTISPECIES: hypothetical protein [unclassified Agarivorans]MDO6687861.1 hypothetical protein [Agarivorans sp. 3_MG-2023]MDO6717483.1 hypothetical protein [Agarivorans sp. 2_MG-2023]